MPSPRVAAAAVAAAVACGWAAWSSSSEPVPPPPARPPAKAAVPTPAFAAVGVGSCAGAACHGGGLDPTLPVQPDDLLAYAGQTMWPSSATAWLTRDPHGNAYKTLASPKSAGMMKRLKWPGAATEQALCLACHANPTLADKTDEASRAAHAEGVGCEACHGNAERWRASHTAKSSRAASYDADGLVDLRELDVRAGACVGCHVGAPAGGGLPLRDVTHEFIAAGHPRLNFDFAGYLRRLPPHWAEKGRAKTFEAQAWLVGRSAAAGAACDLLADRANRDNWPEYAEFNCYSCHHRPGPGGWQPKPLAGRPAGSLKWNAPWSAGELDRYPDWVFGGKGAAAAKTQELADFVNGSPGLVKKIGPLAGEAAADWRRVARGEAGSRYDEADPNRFRKPWSNWLKPTDAELADLDWDAAYRLYSARAASENARLRVGPPKEPSGATDRHLEDLLAVLKFPRHPPRRFAGRVPPGRGGRVASQAVPVERTGKPLRPVPRGLAAVFRPALAALGVLAVAAGLFFALRSPPAPTPGRSFVGKPKLVVLVVFDQMRGDYVVKWHDLFGEGGFKRLKSAGAWFDACHYPYANTMTGPGHSSMLTGCCADAHGIVGNEWYDANRSLVVNCSESDRYTRVPAPAKKADPTPDEPKKDKDEPKEEVIKKTKKEKGSGSPDRILAPTVADALKAATGGKGKVMGLSFKDRSAVLPCGPKADAVYWFDGTDGLVVTSTFYREAVHDWVGAFNESRVADKWFGKDWAKLRDDIDYETYSGPDDAAGEGKGFKQGVAFPHPTDGGAKKLGRGYYEALYNSPYGNDLLLELVKAGVKGMDLGKDDVPDLLSVSFSSNDMIGHTWGPDSQEVLDVTLRRTGRWPSCWRSSTRKWGRGNTCCA